MRFTSVVMNKLMITGYENFSKLLLAWRFLFLFKFSHFLCCSSKFETERAFRFGALKSTVWFLKFLIFRFAQKLNNKFLSRKIVGNLISLNCCMFKKFTFLFPNWLILICECFNTRGNSLIKLKQLTAQKENSVINNSILQHT